jgi:hypothetical protein
MRTSNLVLILFVSFVSLLSSSCKKKYTTPIDSQPPNWAELTASVQNGLWASYTFRSGFTDQSGNNHAFTPSGNLRNTYDMTGNPDEAIEFSGTGDYGIIEDGKDFPDGDFSISFSVMPTVTSGTIFQKADYTSNKGYSFSIGFENVQNDSKLLFVTDKTSDPCNNVFTTNTETATYGVRRDILPDAWFYVTIVYQDGEEKIYINDYLEADLKTPSKALQHCKSAPFYIGVPSSAGIPGFTGKMDNLRLYTRALTPEEVNYLMWAYK